MPNTDRNISKTSKGKNSKKKMSPAVITIILIAVIALVGFAGYYMVRNSTAPQGKTPENMMTYPTVSSSVASSKDGKPHTIDVDIVVEYKDGSQKSIPHEEVYEIIKQTISSLDYEQLKAADSVERVEEAVKANISGRLADDSVSAVYVGNMAIDFRSFFQQNSGSADTGASENMKKLFKNLK